MLKYQFDYNSSHMVVYTESKVSDMAAGKITNLINFIASQFGDHRAIDSEIDIFNNGGIGMPLKLSDEFIDYLKKNIEVAANSKFVFFPFEGVDPKHFEKLFVIEKNGELVKMKGVKLDVSILREPYLVDQISKILEEDKQDSFFINLDNIYSAFGDELFETDYVRQDGVQQRIKLRNQTACFFFNDGYSNEIAYEKISFGSKDRAIVPMYITAIGDCAVSCKTAYAWSRTTSMLGEIEQIARINHCEFRIIIDSGEEIDIKVNEEVETVGA